MLEGVVATKSTPDGVDLKLSNYSTQRHAGHGGRQLRPQDGGGPALPRHSGEDHAAGGGHQGGQLRAREPRRLHAAGLQGRRQRPDCLRPAVGRGHFLVQDSDSPLGRCHHGSRGRRPPRQGGRKRAGLPALHGGRVGHAAGGRHQDSKCPAGSRHQAFVAAQLASRDASITALQGAKADATLLASYATNAALSASETTLQSALDAILAELAALLSGSGGVVNVGSGGCTGPTALPAAPSWRASWSSSTASGGSSRRRGAWSPRRL